MGIEKIAFEKCMLTCLMKKWRVRYDAVIEKFKEKCEKLFVLFDLLLLDVAQPADVASRNLSIDADNFRIERRIVLQWHRSELYAYH